MAGAAVHVYCTRSGGAGACVAGVDERSSSFVLVLVVPHVLGCGR